MNIIVIGAGLAGAACASALARRGCEVTVLAHGGGASELPVGLLAAHLSSQDIELSQLTRIGVSLTLAHARTLLRSDIDWQPCTLEQRLLFQPEKNSRLARGAAALPDWYEVTDTAVMHKNAAWIKPQALVHAWLYQPGIKVREASVAAISRVGGQWQVLSSQGQLIAETTHLLIATGAQSSALLAACGHPLMMDNVSGSVAIGSWLKAWDALVDRRIVNGNGSFLGGVTADDDGTIWVSSATYEREVHDSAQALQAASLEANQARLALLLPRELLTLINAQFVVGDVRSWQGVRCTTSDRLPIVGLLEEGLHVCIAMGSRGLSFAALCAEILAREMMPHALPASIRSSTLAPGSNTPSSALRELLRPYRPTLRVQPQTLRSS